MARPKIKFNQKAVDQLVQDVVQDRAKQMQREMDQFHAQYSGKPVATIKPALKRMWERDGGKLSDQELTEYAQLISEGTKIEFKAG